MSWGHRPGSPFLCQSCCSAVQDPSPSKWVLAAQVQPWRESGTKPAEAQLPVTLHQQLWAPYSQVLKATEPLSFYLLSVHPYCFEHSRLKALFENDCCASV